MSHSSERAKAIRSFFLHIGDMFKGEDKKEEIHKNACESGLGYIRLRLPIEKITSEYEKNLEYRVKKAGLNYTIREAKEEDLESVKDIYNQSWPSTCAPFRPMKLEKFETIFHDKDTTFLIANANQEDAGFVLIDFGGKAKDIAIIAGLGVIPSYQRNGLGTILGFEAWKFLKSKKIKEILCEVYEGNVTSQMFINTFGFEKVEKKKYGITDFLYTVANIK